MKISFYATPNQIKVAYTYKVICHFLKGINFVEPEKADIILVSICDVRDITIVKQARKINPSAYIIMGGAESYIGTPYLAWVDAVCVGEGFQFFELIFKYKDLSISQFIDILEHEPYILTRNKLNEDIYPSTFIPWDKVPAAQLTKNVYYYLMSRGCLRKCKFCYTSWTQKFQVNSVYNLKHVSKVIKERGGKLTLVANDGYGLPEELNINVKSVTAEEFCKNYMAYRDIFYFHFGIEGFCENVRKKIGKPISTECIQKIIKGLKEIRRAAEFLFILGLPLDEDSSEFINCLPLDSDLHPRLQIKFNWLDHCPHTPLWKTEIVEYIPPFDRDKFYYSAIAINRRIRVLPFKDRSSALWRSIFHRCQPDEAVLVEPLKNCKTQQEFWERLDNVGLCGLRNMKKNFPGENIKISF